MERTTCAYKLKEGVAEVVHKRLVHELKEKPFSINLDECTTKGSNQRILSILVSFFSDTLGPRVEQSFSMMNDTITAKTNRIHASTFAAIQTVKYDLLATRETSVQRYHRENKLKSPVDVSMAYHVRTAYSLFKKKNATSERKNTKNTKENIHKLAQKVKERIRIQQASVRKQNRLKVIQQKRQQKL
ncbi:hypothetical protein HOLleu_11125 [Holothuria leucospilota]|uniref:Uncharacterized protein n=1 Tax=Holothuria leucospilota TaxID=206669 RepID=A0A9Q1CEI3_HOLLE|nr:hypothetical protein HOLleu_11125 [Holothuria leucospilota]